MHAEAAQALFNDVPAHDLTLDLGVSSRNRTMPTRQRSKSDTYMVSPTALEGPTFSFNGPESARQNQQRQPEAAIDPRALDGSSPGWESFKASAMALRQHQGSALVTDEDDQYLSAGMPSQAGPSARRRSAVESGPYDSLGLDSSSYLMLPSPGGIRRSQSHGSGHKRGAQSENYTASTFSPRDAQFSGAQQSYSPGGYGQTDGNRLISGGYEPQTYSQNPSQYDLSNLPPMPTAFLSGQENQYGLPTSSSIGDYSRQPSVDYGQQQPQQSHLSMQQPSYQNYLPAMPTPYGMQTADPLAQNTPYLPYTPAGLTYNPGDVIYGQTNVVYDPENRFITGPTGLLDPGRMRRRSSVRSDASGVSGLSGASEFTWESKTTEATKQAAKRRRKDPSAAKFVCEYCNETFTRAYNLKGHIRSHEGLKPFTCEVCSKGQRFLLVDNDSLN